MPPGAPACRSRCTSSAAVTASSTPTVTGPLAARSRPPAACWSDPTGTSPGARRATRRPLRPISPEPLTGRWPGPGSSDRIRRRLRMSTDAPVAIAGGGIAGLCIGLMLRRRGLDAVVYEQAETPNEFGAGVQLAPNATKLLARLGLGQQLADICAAPARIQVRRWANDAVLTTTTLGTTFEQRFGGPYYTAHRGELHSILLTAFGSDSVRYGARYIGLRRGPDATVLEFAHGSQASPQILVGADA